MKKIWKKLLSVTLTLSMTMSMVSMTSLAAEGETDETAALATCCGYEAHTHNENCYRECSEAEVAKGDYTLSKDTTFYKLTCMQEEHTHTNDCYAAVKAFLTAVAAIPEEITVENWKDAQPKVNEACEAYGALYALWEAGTISWTQAYNDAYNKVAAADEAVKEFKKAAEEAEAAEKLANCPFVGVWSTDESGRKVLTITGKGVYEGTFALVENGERVKLSSTRNQEESFDLVLNVTEIKEALFVSNTKIAKVTLNEVKEIGKNAFQRSGLTELVLNNVGHITVGAFSYCGSLTSVKLSNIGSFDHSVFYQSNLTEATISNCSEISYRAFRGCPALETVTITDVPTVGWLAFQSCGKLTTVTMSGVDLVEGGAFEDCNSLASISIGENTKLGYVDANRNLIEVIPGVAGRMEAILKGQFALDSAETIEDITVGVIEDGWNDGKTAKSENWDQYDYGTQLVEQARWTNPGTGASANTEVEVKVDAYYTSPKQMDFIFVLDLSNSMTKLGNATDMNARFYDMQSKLLDVTDELMNTPGYDCRVAFTTFGLTSTESFDFCADSAAARNAILGLAPYYENTNYGLGLRGAQTLLESQEAGRDTTVIFISDGQPRDGKDNSTYDLNGAISATDIKNKGVSIYGVLQSVPDDEHESAVAAMKDVCSEGLFFESSSTQEFSAAVNQAIAATYNDHTVIIPVNPAFENVRGLTVSASAGEASYDAAAHTITWTITGMPFIKHTLTYQMSLTAENAAKYGDQSYPVNSGNAAIKDGASVESPVLTRTVERPYVPPVTTTYSVRYSWTGLPAEATETLPATRSYEAGTAVTVNATYTEGTEVTVGETTYVFSGWDTEDFTMPARNVEIKGVWTAKPAEEDVEETDTPTTESPEPTETQEPDETEDLGDNDTPLAENPGEGEDLGDNDTPLAENPDEGEDLGDNDTPLAEVPQTGDMLWLWMTLAAGSAVSLAWISAEEKKGKRVSK